jgi:hypothetical protein
MLHLQLDKAAADAAEYKAGYDKVTADAVEFKAGYDKLLVDSAEQQAQLDKAAADASEFKAGYDKLVVDSVEQKAQVRGRALLSMRGWLLSSCCWRRTMSTAVVSTCSCQRRPCRCLVCDSLSLTRTPMLLSSCACSWTRQLQTPPSTRLATTR